MSNNLNSTYDDTKVSRSMSSKENGSVYASMLFGNYIQLHLIVLNKKPDVNLWDLALLSENWDFGTPCQ